LYNGFIYRLDPKNGEIISTVSRDRFFKWRFFIWIKKLFSAQKS
jgi:hypothetical protein